MLISKKISLQTQFKIEYALIKGFYFCCRVMPSQWVIALGKGIGALAWKLKARRQTTLENLKLAFGSRYSEVDMETMARKSYIHFGQELMRIFILERESRRPIEQWIDIEGYDLIKNRTAAGGVLVSGHLGCWEVANFLLPRLGERITVYTGKHANKTADRFLNELRSRAGTQTSSASDDREELIKKAKRGLVALAGDIRPPKAPVLVRFFGQETQAVQGPALLSLLNEVDLYYFSCVKEGPRLKVKFQKVEFTPAATRRENIKRLTQAFFDTLQKDIESYPDQYYWMHRRWKNREDVHYAEKDSLF